MQQVFGFLQESWSEVGKVVWPTREQAIRLTAITLAVTFGVAAFTAFFDYILNGLLTFLIQK
ncbi:preprotein translocase subunit SecE [candidate division WWE3 bacterium RIFCSPHIGHO2_01_FULL_48_15]|uniref:Protein translocase subunit SecE n=1 Tax=candidate division WWE3 bacterium RIFCSPHIGHO2_01_FULL_48_15 TaxID=1802619 RepID=A0A1F4VGK6_UNCKA|nr:MAG: preprotein translocase subunit SecE [candidate division WWE3 bacterium RIFCSPHIGHO2_01_FULL_48_15]